MFKTSAKISFVFLFIFLLFFRTAANAADVVQSWVRINQLGYAPDGVKVAVFVSKASSAAVEAADEYAEFQSDLAVYHDDFGDYSTNEPTMDGTASLIYMLAAKENEAKNK